MKSPYVARILLAIAALSLGLAQAFTWELLEFPAGNQHYTVEFIQGGDAATRVVLDIVIVDHGGSFTVTTTTTSEQRDVAQDDLAGATLGGSMMMAYGPALMFGPTFMLFPLLLGEEEIRVRSEPLVLVGFGRLYMEREEVVAGRTCVVIRFEPAQAGMEASEFAVADGVPFPCFSRYGSGSDGIEVRLLRAE
jgi:hypothetical protein